MSAPLQAPSWDTSSLLQALQAASLQQPSNQADWYMDSGASSHMTGDQGNLTSYFPSLSHDTSQIVVDLVCPFLAMVAHISELPLLTSYWPYVLHTPSLVSNLISVRKFTKDNWCSVKFDPFGFSMKDLITKTPILRSNSSSDLYPFAGSSTLHNKFVLSATISSADVWHHRLGHPSSASLSHLIFQFSIPCNNKQPAPSVCEVCQQGKHVQLPFAQSNMCTYFPFHIIHCDLWTSPVESVTGFKYYMIVIDDFSWYTWTFPLCLKSNVASTLRDFYSYVLNQFHLSMQCIQCENGCEFDNHALCSFFTTKGSIFHFSCPHTPPQNGKTECGIWSINNIMHTLLFQAHLDMAYWVEALHTATYLFNRRHSLPLHLHTPYEALFLQPPDYSHLWTFSCL
jgi:hypothetical protein